MTVGQGPAADSPAFRARGADVDPVAAHGKPLLPETFRSL
jgi:hypothetical protein